MLGMLLALLAASVLTVSPSIRTIQNVESFMSRQKRNCSASIVKRVNPSCIIVEPQYYPPSCQQALDAIKESPMETHAYILQGALAQFCTPACLQPQIQFWSYCIHNESMVQYYKNFVCAGNRNGFCLVQLQLSLGHFQYLQCAYGSYCPDTCRENYLSVKKQMGCCFGTFFDALSPYGGHGPHALVNYYELLMCSINPGKHCKSLYSHASVITINSYLTIVSLLCVLIVSLVLHF